ncbi:MAG: hypothetical protein WD009_09320 [Phycisphaeraceae bacterium]
MSSIDPYLAAMMGGQRAGRTRLDAQGRIAQDVTCNECGYNLRGLDSGRPCPECGNNLASSLMGDELHHANPAWLGRLRLGALLLLIGIGAVAVQWVTIVGAIFMDLFGATPTWLDQPLIWLVINPAIALVAALGLLVFTLVVLIWGTVLTSQYRALFAAAEAEAQKQVEG